MSIIPSATYRIQFNAAFTFGDLEKVVPFLARMGVGAIYASPIFKARRLSTHGYDVVDFNEINPELGGRSGFDSLIAEVKRLHMGWIQDLVPNHMAYSAQNQILVDVGENGRNSRYFDFFDVEWDHPYEGIKGRVLAPFLGSFYGECLENGEIQICYDEKGFAVKYYDIRLPLRLESYADLLTYDLSSLRTRLSANHPDFIKLHGILGVLFVLKTLPSGEVSNERYDQIGFVKILLWELYDQNPAIRAFIDETIRILNDRPARETSIVFMERLLGDQHYRLSHWKVAVEEINYRRFFTINELISLRIENPKVFDHVHALILRLIKEDSVSGLRIDHIDGLYDPTQYLLRLGARTGDLYTVVEKILAFGETIPEFWPVAGTTGYDFLGVVNGLFCDGRNEKAFDRIYARFTGDSTPFAEIVFAKKKLILERRMAGDLENLAHIVKKISARYRRGSDLTMLGIKRAIVQVLASFPVYRTYFNEDSCRPGDRDYVRLALAGAREKAPDLVHEFHFIEKLHSPEFLAGLAEEDRREWLNALMRFQQLTAPLMAKGFEDTVLYVYNRLLSLNEVGGSPEQFGVGVEVFHEFNRNRRKLSPYSLTATATHDTKRGEDVRARINVLSELPGEWERRLRAWSRLNARCKTRLNGRLVPEKIVEYGLYQTLLGAFPPSAEPPEDLGDFVERMKAYAVKAAREAKTSTSWLVPDPDYENAVISFIGAILRPEPDNLFLKEFMPFQKKIAFFGCWNSLAQTLLKIASPGVPDFYQGTELWDLNLVDPDNRRPVDFSQREQILEEIVRRSEKDILGLIAKLLSSREDGRVKLFLIHRALEVRRETIELFNEGTYFPIKVRGRHQRQVVALGRQWGDLCAVAAVPRLLAGLVQEGEPPLGEVWGNTALLLPGRGRGIWSNRITGQVLEHRDALPVGEVFAHFPAALLVSSSKNPSKLR